MTSRRDASGRDQGLAAHIFALAEQERRLGRVRVAFDVSDKNDVVAAVVPILVAAFEMRRRADQDGSAAFGNDVVDLGKLVLMLASEVIRQLDLVIGQNVDDKVRPLLERRKAVGVERSA